MGTRNQVRERVNHQNGGLTPRKYVTGVFCPFRGVRGRKICEYPANLVEQGVGQPKKLEVSLRLLSPLGSIRTLPGGVSRPSDLFLVEPEGRFSARSIRFRG